MTARFDVAEAIDRQPTTRRQVMVIALIALCLVMDGYDLQAMGYAAPSILKEWNLAHASLGPVFSAGVFGMLVGSLLLSSLGDRFGRKPVILLATLSFAVCMLGTCSATTTTELMLWRFASGLGPGCILPNAMALASEFSPKHTRVTSMMVVGCGFGLGGTAGGALSAWLVPLYGWHAIFLFGGALSIVLVAVMVFVLPESVQFLTAKAQNAKASNVLSRVFPGIRVPDGASLHVSVAENHQKVSPLELLREGRGIRTVTLWVINFANLLNMYLLANWLPTFMRDAGYDHSTAALAGSVLWGAGVAGNLLLGPAIDRFGFKAILTPLFLVATIAIAAIGNVTVLASVLMTFAAVAFAGFSVIGGQPALNALSATTYPTHLRSTGVGWSLGVGRVGSIVGPLLCAWMISLEYSATLLFLAAAVPALISMIGMASLRNTPRLGSKSDQNTESHHEHPHSA